MSFIIPSDAYGERTSSLQAIITQAEGISLFSNRVAADEAKLAEYAWECLTNVSLAEEFMISRWTAEIVRGPSSVLADRWIGQTEKWRGAIGAVIGEMHRRYSSPPHADRVKPPVWPVAGTINIFGPTFESWRGRSLLARRVFC